MLLSFLLIHLGFCYSSIKAHRFIQYQSNQTNNTVVGSTRVSIDHPIGDFHSPPNSNNAIFIPLDTADFDTIVNHINASSPIIFLVGQNPINTKQLEEFLLSAPHKAPIYFAYDTATIPKEFTYVKTSGFYSSNPIKKTKLQNLIGTLNSSISFDHEKIAVITAPLDSFSTVPSARIGANNNGLSLAAFLETMYLVSKFPLTNNWAFVFALTDGHFCSFEGLERAMNSLSREHGSKIKFAISIESISSPKGIRGLFSMKLKRGSAFAKFMECLIEALKSSGVEFNFGISEEKRTQTVFAKHKIPSVALLNEDGDEISHITDFIPDVERANAIAWSIAEALLRMMYDSDNTASMIDKSQVDSSFMTNTLQKFSRMPQFRDQTSPQIFSQLMSKFSTISAEDWQTQKCPTVYSTPPSNLILYNPTPIMTNVILFVSAFGYGIVVFIFIAGIENIKRRFFK